MATRSPTSIAKASPEPGRQRPDMQKFSAAAKPTLKPPPLQKTPIQQARRPVSAASIARTRDAFKSFTLSRFAGSSLPYNYVPAGQHPAAAQKAVITNHLDKLKSQGASNRAMTVALPKAMLEKLLPSYAPKTGTLELDELMSLTRKKMRGTQFRTNGNPMLNRLAVRSKARQIVDGIKKGGAK